MFCSLPVALDPTLFACSRRPLGFKALEETRGRGLDPIALPFGRYPFEWRTPQRLSVFFPSFFCYFFSFFPPLFGRPGHRPASPLLCGPQLSGNAYAKCRTSGVLLCRKSSLEHPTSLDAALAVAQKDVPKMGPLANGTKDQTCGLPPPQKGLSDTHVAMGRNPVPPVNIPIPTKIN